jgi:DNA modification methylase
VLTTDHALHFTDARSLDFLPDNSIDLVVTSPPYPMIEMWDLLFRKQNRQIVRALDEHEGRTAFELMHHELDKVWKELYRVLKDGSFACINVGDATRTLGKKFQLFSNHSRVLSACMALGFETLPLILWRKQTNAPNKFMGSGMLPAGAYVTLEHEYILILRKSRKRAFEATAEKKRRKESAFFWEERNRWFSDIWDFKGTRQSLKDNRLRERSAAFPFELPWRLINMYSLKGDTVLDPFTGTGTTLQAAMAGCRNSIGVEADVSFRQPFWAACRGLKPQLNEIIRQRLSDHLAFVQQHESAKGALKYVNRHYGFPVVTEQESDLILHQVEDIHVEEKDSIRVEYEPLALPDPAEGKS